MSAPALYLDGRVAVHSGDCLDVVRTLADNSIDAVVTDPPYALTSIVKRFGPSANGHVSTEPKAGATGAYARAAKGFMGKAWDNGSTAFSVDFWAEVWRVLKPGAHVVAFGGTRTYHRLGVAIEDAGFECRDAVMWHYGTGFPKSHDPAKGIARIFDWFDDDERAAGQCSHSEAIWTGWGTALKPGTEIIFVGRKPLSEGTVAANVLRWGVGALNIDGCRIGDFENSTPSGIDRLNQANFEQGYRPSAYGRDGEASAERRYTDQGATNFGAKPGPRGGSPAGRWPANLIHDGSDEVLARFPDSTSGTGAVKRATGSDTDGNTSSAFGKESRPAGTPMITHGDTGSAARFFASFPQENEPRCDLCGLLCGVQLDTNQLCNANNAESASQTQNIQIAAFVPGNAAVLRAPESADKSNPSSATVNSVASHSQRSRPLEAECARASVPPLLLSRIVQNVRSAAKLCDLCATAIAQGLVGPKTRQSLESLPLPDFISERSARILRHNLALHVEGRENTDIITTTASLKQLFGSVFHVIECATVSEESPKDARTKFAKRFHYSGKADSDSRLGSKHPTVKPVDLMQWLCRLVCPPGGTVLDPFAGTGTTGAAAWREGFRAVLIEREAEYLVDIARRMKLCLGGPDERAREAIKARLAGKPVDSGPLFAQIEASQPASQPAKYAAGRSASKFFVSLQPIEPSDQSD